MPWKSITIALVVSLWAQGAFALDEPDKPFKIFQFPPSMIPRINGKADDWDIVPDDYAIGMDNYVDDMKHFDKPDLHRFNVTVKVGWVKGMNQLFFLYQATKSYWDFGAAGLHNDTFEVVVDGDESGGPLVDEMNLNGLARTDAYFIMHGVHAQNYHIFTPSEGKDWCMFWGPQAKWIKQLPYSNFASSYDFKPGQPGKLTMTFWITPFDFASPDGPDKSVMSKLEENKTIGLSWALLDYGDANLRPLQYTAFWNLSRHHEMYGNASYLRAFKLMPLEEKYRKAVDCNWTFQTVDADKREVMFTDQSVGQFTSWKWDFGDGATSTDENPTHSYGKAGRFIVTLEVDGPSGKIHRTKVWDVAVK